MYTVHMDTHYQLVILRPPTREHPAVSVDRAHLAEVLGGVAPVIAYAEDERGRIVFPVSPDGDRLARCLAAQLTLCAAGLWLAAKPDPIAMMAAIVRQVSDVPSTTPTPAWLQAVVAHAVSHGWDPAQVVARQKTVPAGPHSLAATVWHVYPDAAAADAPRPSSPRDWRPTT